MSLGLTLTGLVGITAVVFIAGAINGFAGFGFALVGTMALATVVDPATAVVFMMIPILGVNVSLIHELSLDELRTCWSRFGPLILAALVGTVVGLVILDRVPQGPLKIGLGGVALAFVANTQKVVPVPGIDSARDGCFVETKPAMVGVGALSGLLFGGTNVGVQFVAYLRSCNLPHGTFVGVVAMVFVGLNGIRIGVAGMLGLYPSAAVVAASVAVTVPAVAGVVVGTRFRSSLGERFRRSVVLGVLTVIGLQLVATGSGFV